MQNWITAALALLCAASATQLAAKECSAKSGERSVALLELYTSEGCNSCPPADAWVNDLNKRGVGIDRLVPLALHVDYWDYIGWKDPFAKAHFTERQRAISRRNGLGTIYTPQVVLNGVTMQGWGRNDKLNAALDLIQDGKARADITLVLRNSGAEHLAISATAAVPNAKDKVNSALFLAVYESGLSSDVRAGENRGVTLRHNHVVREWIGPLPVDAGAPIAREVTLARDWQRQNLGVAAFVENGETGAILQALALPVCN